jgi:hypothetical protein
MSAMKLSRDLQDRYDINKISTLIWLMFRFNKEESRLYDKYVLHK